MKVSDRNVSHWTDEQETRAIKEAFASQRARKRIRHQRSGGALTWLAIIVMVVISIALLRYCWGQ